jgi:LuxR family maltose regulon positive regulatory protein
MPDNLLRTKLYAPPLRSKLVPRRHLIERLNQGLQSGHKITLVSAPAGFGKTACVSEWAEGSYGASDHRISWLSLDPADDDPGRFFAYFIAALQQVEITLGQEIEGVLHAGQIPPGDVISTSLTNDILEFEGRFVLILDDFHVIQDPFILQVIEELVTVLPQQLHLILITREDPPLPLARLRANNQLTEIRAADLRFSGRDTEQFLNEVMGLSLSQKDIAVLENKTEGWIAGLQLAGLSVRERADPSAFIASLSGSHRFILNYLTEEVLNRQPEEVQRFLLQTSILNRLSGDLCNAVTGRTDGRFMLEQLFNANLFVISLDDEQNWYRYHHLFSDLLRDLQNSLLKEETVELHRRASHWYAAAGMGSEAIQHALAAEDYALAVELLESHALRLIMQGYVKTVNRWVQAIPEQWQSQSPKTNLAFAWMHLLRGAYDEASPYLERMRPPRAGEPVGHPLSEEEALLRAEWMVMQSLVMYMQGETAESKAMAERALDMAPEKGSRVRSLAYFALASSYRIRGEQQAAEAYYQKSIQYGRASENLVAEMMSTVGLIEMALEHGHLHLAFEIVVPVITRLEKAGALPPPSAGLYGLLGEIYYQWFQLEEARRHIVHARQLSMLGGYNTVTISHWVLLSRLSQLEGDLESAFYEIQEAKNLVQVDTSDFVRVEILAQEVRVFLDRNRPAAAERALKGQGFSFEDQFTYPDLPQNQNFSQISGLLYNRSLSVLLHQTRVGGDLIRLKQGMELADQLVARGLHNQLTIMVLETLLLRAQMHAELGNSEDNQADTIAALEMAEPQGVIGVFVEQRPFMAGALTRLAKNGRLDRGLSDFVARIQAAFSGLKEAGTARQTMLLAEPLTEREMEVLQLMAEGLKYKEIAAQLFISLNTVRYHVKAIYGKLNVRNRTQATETARQLQIL